MFPRLPFNGASSRENITTQRSFLVPNEHSLSGCNDFPCYGLDTEASRDNWARIQAVCLYKKV